MNLRTILKRGAIALATAVVFSAVLVMAGCSVIPSSIVSEQTSSNTLIAAAASNVEATMRAEYVEPAKASDVATINAGLQADVANNYGKLDAAAYNSWFLDARAKADRSIELKLAQREAPMQQLQAIKAQAESNTKVAVELAKKVNGEE